MEDIDYTEIKGFKFYYKVLRPCPFCGGTDLWFQRYLADGWIECATCEARGPSDYRAQTDPERCERKAAELWNSRKVVNGLRR